MKISNETKVGALTAVALTVLILGYNYMRGENILETTNSYYAVYQQVDGLFGSNPVTINGHKVGQVSKVQMDYKSLNVVVEIKIPKEIIVPKSSVLTIVNNDLIGSKAVELVMGEGAELASSGDTLAGDQEEGTVQAISKVLTPLSRQVDQILGEIDTAVSGVSLQRTLNELSGALSSFKLTADKLNIILEGKDAELDKIFADLSALSGELKNSSPKIDSILAQFQVASNDLASADLSGTVASLGKSVENINTLLDGINKGEGSLGKLTTSDELYVNLNRASNNLDSLLVDIQKYPSRYTGFTNRQRKKANAKKDDKK